VTVVNSDVDGLEPGAVPDHLVLEQDLRDAVVHLDDAATVSAVEHARVLLEDLHRLLDPLGQVPRPLDPPAHWRRVPHDHRGPDSQPVLGYIGREHI